jgi:putative peptide zinc metalloprotease protein
VLRACPRGVDRRVVFLVFETDLSQLWTLPRGRRIGPLLAGMAIDAVLLCGVLLTGEYAGGGGGLTAAWAFFLVSQIAWQCMVFLRTDLYAVLVTVTGCRNLWRVKTLLLRRAFGRLNEAERAELSAAADADLRVGRWFRWLWVAGFAVVAAWVAAFPLPTIPPVLEWAADGLAGSPGGWGFWSALGGAVLFFGPWALVLALVCRDLLRHDRLRTGSAFERRSP